MCRIDIYRHFFTSSMPLTRLHQCMLTKGYNTVCASSMCQFIQTYYMCNSVSALNVMKWMSLWTVRHACHRHSPRPHGKRWGCESNGRALRPRALSSPDSDWHSLGCTVDRGVWKLIKPPAQKAFNWIQVIIETLPIVIFLFILRQTQSLLHLEHY